MTYGTRTGIYLTSMLDDTKSHSERVTDRLTTELSCLRADACYGRAKLNFATSLAWLLFDSMFGVEPAGPRVST